MKTADWLPGALGFGGGLGALMLGQVLKKKKPGDPPGMSPGMSINTAPAAWNPNQEDAGARTAALALPQPGAGPMAAGAPMNITPPVPNTMTPGGGLRLTSRPPSPYAGALDPGGLGAARGPALPPGGNDMPAMARMRPPPSPMGPPMPPPPAMAGSTMDGFMPPGGPGGGVAPPGPGMLAGLLGGPRMAAGSAVPPAEPMGPPMPPSFMGVGAGMPGAGAGIAGSAAMPPFAGQNFQIPRPPGSPMGPNLSTPVINGDTPRDRIFPGMAPPPATPILNDTRLKVPGMMGTPDAGETLFGNTAMPGPQGLQIPTTNQVSFGRNLTGPATTPGLGLPPDPVIGQPPIAPGGNRGRLGAGGGSAMMPGGSRLRGADTGQETMPQLSPDELRQMLMELQKKTSKVPLPRGGGGGGGPVSLNRLFM